MDDIGIKESKTTYNNKKVIFGIRRYILKHIIWMDGVLANLERVRCTISGVKLQFYMLRLRVLRFICDILKRYSDISKVIKIIEWLPPNDIIEARAFIKVAVYYKIFIKNLRLSRRRFIL
jgi:hypothetical protein